LETGSKWLAGKRQRPASASGASSPGSMTAVEVIARALKDAGVRRMYGVPGGGSVLDLIEAGRRAGIRFVLTAAEGAAAMMAATEAELTGVPGVCLTTLGPGAANAANGVAHAALDRAPILIVTDRYPAGLPGTVTRQRLDHPRLYAGLVKGSFTVGAPGAGAIVGRALRLARLAPRGPVHLDLPSDVAGRVSPPPRPPAPAPRPPAPSARAVQRARAWLARARRPLILAGLGLGTDAAAKALVGLAEDLQAPVLTTYKAKGVIPDAHPLAAGPLAGGTFEDRLIGRADLLLAVSGTVTLEAAILGTPMIISYRLGFLSWCVGRLLIHVRFIGLPNLVAGEGIVPELIQFQATPERMAAAASEILDSPERLARMRIALGEVRRRLGTPGATERAAREVLALLPAA